MEEEEIDSDLASDAGSDVPVTQPDGLRDARGSEESYLEEDDGDTDETVPGREETAEEKRLRLARAYLTKAGIDPDAAAEESDEDNLDDRPRSDALRRLQHAAARDSGRESIRVAESVREHLESDGQRGVVVRAVRGHDTAATCVSILDDGTRAVSGGKDSRVILWDVETGTKLAKWRPEVYKPSFHDDPSRAPGHVGHVLAVAMAGSYGGNVLASGGSDQLVRLWDARSKTQVDALQGHRGIVTCLSFRSGSVQLFSGSADRTVKIWDGGERAYVESLFGHGSDVCGVDSWMKERALSCGRDGTLRLYKIVEGSQLVFKQARTPSIDAVAMMNEQRFVSGGDDGSIALWHVNKKRPVATIQCGHGSGTGSDAWISSVGVGRNTDLAVSGAGDGMLRFWECEDKPPGLARCGAIATGPGFVNGIAVGAGARLVVAAVGQEHRLGRWNRMRGVKTGLRFVRFPDS